MSMTPEALADESRAAFEAWVDKFNKRHCQFSPGSPVGGWCWEAWQAARSLPPAPQEQPTLTAARIAEIIDTAWTQAEFDTAVCGSPETEWSRYGENVARAIEAAVSRGEAITDLSKIRAVPKRLMEFPADVQHRFRDASIAYGEAAFSGGDVLETWFALIAVVDELLAAQEHVPKPPSTHSIETEKP